MSILNDRQIAAYCGIPNDDLLRHYVVSIGDQAPKSIRGFPDLYIANQLNCELNRDCFLETPTMMRLCDLEENDQVSFIAPGEQHQLVTVTRLPNHKPMITPFVNESVRVSEQGERILSYGVSSFGYDFRIAPEFKIFTNALSVVVDPKQFDPKAFVEFEGEVCIIPPNSFVLARTLERFCMPDTVLGLVSGKSTYARVGIFPLVTPAEPGWEGYLTLEFANSTPLPAKLYANEGGLQMAFFEGERPITTYSDRAGKYQDQGPTVVLPRL